MRVLERIAPLSGLAASAAILTGVSFADASRTGLDPDPTDPSSLIAEALVRNRGPGRLGAQLLLLGGFLMLWFVSYLYGHLRKAEGRSGWTSALVLGGGSVLVTLLLIESGVHYAASEIADYAGDTEVAKLLHLWGWNSASLLAPGFGAILAGSAVAGFRDGAIPRGLAWFTVVMFVILGLIAVVLRAPGLGAGIGTLWTVVTSLTLTVSRGTRSAPSPE